MIKQIFIPGAAPTPGNGGSNNKFWFILFVLAGVGVCIYLAKNKPYVPELKQPEAKKDNNSSNPPKTEVQNG